MIHQTEPQGDRVNIKATASTGCKRVLVRTIDNIVRIGDAFEAKAEGYVPFTPLNIAYNHLDKRVKTILDLGCGKGDPMLFINRHHNFYIVGVDIFPEYLSTCKEKSSHNELVQLDIRELAFPPKSFDAVLALRILEHLTKAEGTRLLAKLEAIARYQIILITPMEVFKQSTYDANEFQEHKSTWSPDELKELGFRVYPNGLRGIQKDTAHITRLGKTVAGLGHVLWVLAGPIVKFFPSLAANIVAVKNQEVLDNTAR